MALSWFLLLSLTISTLLNIGLYSAAQDNRKLRNTLTLSTWATVQKMRFQWHSFTNMLQNVVGSDIAPGSLLHSYKRSFNGFVAKLTGKEAQEMAGKEGVVSVFPSEKQELHTTRSWDFIGFPQQVKRSTLESDIIIGVIDSGIWPQSSSFDDKGFGPPPSKWKGSCQVSSNFSCNNKIIGAKYHKSDGFFVKGEILSPLGSAGHGTHTASAAAGGLVSGASLSGFGLGTARGGVPSACLAVYKVRWPYEGCQDADILAASDDAIADGVDIISVSLGSSARDYFQNSIAIGAFHAMKKGILTSTSAGNNPSSLTKFSPWSISVAASTMDRNFVTNVQLGNDKIYEGTSINTFDMKNKQFPIIYGGDAPNTKANYDSSLSRYCVDDSLDKNLVKDKIVLCDGYTTGTGAQSAGAVDVVMSGGAFGKLAGTYPLPLSSLGLEDSAKLYVYLNSSRKPTASIWKSKEKSDKLAPYIASYSSRGPNPITPSILKPDLAAPRTYILAAWPPYISVSRMEGDNRIAAYNILFGISMSCPHASAATAYVKSFHPTWSLAAIKSSLMTTAKPITADLNSEAEFAYGSGLINPLKVAYPGLVYDIDENDYINFLCGRYNAKLLKIITGNSKSSCPKGGDGTVSDLNYPAFVVSASPLESINHVFNRTVTNVGSPTSTYKANLVAPPGLKITVNPSVMSFTSVGEKLSYAVTVQGTVDRKVVVSASLVWDNGTCEVRSPIVVYVLT